MEIDNIKYTDNEEINMLIEAINLRFNYVASSVTTLEEEPKTNEVKYIENEVRRDGLEYVLRFKTIPANNAKNRSLFVDATDEVLKYKSSDGTLIPLT